MNLNFNIANTTPFIDTTHSIMNKIRILSFDKKVSKEINIYKIQ